MPNRALRYAVAAVALYASQKAAFLTYQAHDLLIEPYSTVGTGLLVLLASALAATGILAILGCVKFHALALLVCILAPSLLVVGISRVAGTHLLEAFRQAACLQPVGLCFPQVASFLYVLPVLAVVSILSLLVAVRRPTLQSGA
jgi:hypothetical protein